MEPVASRPGLRLFLLLFFAVLIVGKNTSSKSTNAGQNAPSDLELFLPFVVNVEPTRLTLPMSRLEVAFRGMVRLLLLLRRRLVA
jgi:hypothetical protein